jgi:hypothetical protein
MEVYLEDTGGDIIDGAELEALIASPHVYDVTTKTIQISRGFNDLRRCRQASIPRLRELRWRYAHPMSN